MKTFETEKHNIPEGATHYYHSIGGVGFYKLTNSSWEFWQYFYNCWKPVCDNNCAFEAIPIPQTNIETPEEKYVEWKSGDKCVYNGDEFLFVGMMISLV
ncbi:hypothetical protein NVP1291O_71 [Vibrio phage 1.291.O._10N.286.55.F6]|nr:hypothetical protein NVP1291O_71 [Vibrio phage 1.291.O._10N.286.55.F6]